MLEGQKEPCTAIRGDFDAFFVMQTRPPSVVVVMYPEELPAK